ncbi:nicotinate-nucleotide adenylyltransferase [Tundrisphaera sp. TA3]|uniref:nicotinate-nucleotide adenylyltransferase n=1 Tax=Tundrisphaera sp. TA3 TaxID=3435775 RepID=UPI003EBFE667
MQLGLFGGTFDPIHVGHLILAETCREALGLDRVWFVVAGSPPHKPGGRTAVAHRIEMVRLAIAGNPAFEVSEIEAKRPGPHYSVETLEAIRRDRPEDDLSFLIGADSLVDLPQWREPGRIMELARLVVVNRPGFEPPPFDPPPGARPIARIDVPPIGIASHAIRRMLREGRSARYQIPHAVKAYIDAHGLYRAEDPTR